MEKWDLSPKEMRNDLGEAKIKGYPLYQNLKDVENLRWNNS